MDKKGLGLSRLGVAILIICLAMASVVYAGDTAQDTLTTSLVLGNAAPVVNDVVVQNSGAYKPTSCSTTEVTVRFNATDDNGWEDIDLTNGSTNCTLAKGGTTATLSAGTCTKVSNSTSTKALFQCTGDMQYYYLTGADWAVTCAVVDSAAATDNNATATMTYNRLEDIVIVDASAAWTSITTSSTDVASDDNAIVVNNCGNAYFATLNVTGYDLIGATTATDKIPASDFSCNDAAAAGGEALVNTTATTMTGGALLIGSGVSEDVYLYLEQITVPVSAQTYNSESAWQIMLYGADNTNP